MPTNTKPVDFPCEVVRVFPEGSREREILNAFADRLNTGFLDPRFQVEDVIFDHDTNQRWTTILGRTGYKLTVQVLSPVEQWKVLTGNGAEAVAIKLREGILGEKSGGMI